MKPLLILLISFLSSLIITKILFRKSNFKLSGIIAMGIMLAFTAIGHFIYSDGMAMMIPDFIPFKIEIVFLTGILEILVGVALLFQRIRKSSAILLIIFFIMIVPANINAAINHLNFSDVADEGPGIVYLWFRIPLQLFFILWVYIFGIRK